MIQGSNSLAFSVRIGLATRNREDLIYALNNSLTRRLPTPTYFSSNDAALANKIGTLASPAMARASIVFPVPAGPWSRTPVKRVNPMCYSAK